MVDAELKNYITKLFEKGYDIDVIKQSLITAGHDLSKVENLTSEVFFVFHQELISLVDSEIAKGTTVDTIKNNLLGLGHSEKKLRLIIDHVTRKKKKSFLPHLSFHFALTSKKNILFMLGGCILFTILLSVAFFVFAERELSLTDRIELCNQNDEYYSSLCLSLVTNSISYCDNITTGDERSRCVDSHFLYSYYNASVQNNCDSIQNINLREFCLQLSTNSCDGFLTFPGYCQSIVNNDPSCENTKEINDKVPIIESCTNNYYLWKSMTSEEMCDSISKNELQVLCQAVT